MSGEQPEQTVVDVPERERFEIRRGGETVGFVAYQRAGRLVVLTHTEVDPSLEGQGVGSVLVRGVLDDLRREGASVLPLCPFVQAWMGRHHDYHDLDYRRPRSQVTD